MTDRERLEEIEKDWEECFIAMDGCDLHGDDITWLIDTLRKYIDEHKYVQEQYKLFCRVITEYDELMLKRRKELDIYNKEHLGGKSNV